MRDLDDILLNQTRRESPIGFVEASAFIVGLKKIAEGEVPNTTGAVEGPFLVPLPEAIALMAQMVSNEFKTQVYYTYYANMLRGLSHEGIAEEFVEHAKDELEHADYLLRRIGVLSPGGISIPPYEPPPPMTDPQEIVRHMIVVEQMGISLWKQLHSICGDNPMKYTIEQYLQKEEEHQDELWQLVDPNAPAEAAVEAAQPEAPKTAEAIFAAALERKKEASHALTRAELVRAGMDPSYAGKKEQGGDKDPLASWKGAADLTPAARAQIAEKNYVFPEQKKYPIHDKDHALAALGMVAMHGSPSEQTTVRSAVEKKYPGLSMQKKSGLRPEELQAALALAKKKPVAKAVSAVAPSVQQLRHLARTGGGGSPILNALGHVNVASDESKEAMDRDKVIKDKAKQLISSATERFRKLMDQLPKKDQVRSEITQRPPESLLHEKGVFDVKTKPAVVKQSSLGDLVLKHANIMVPPPGADTPEAYVMREQQLAAQQAMAEAAHAKTVSMQASQAAQQAQAESQAAQQQLQESQQQLQEMQAQAQQASQAQIQAQQAAAEAESRAAEHSISKMQLGMRVNQMRQELANLVMQDPVSEHAATVSDLAAQGQPATPQQQQEVEAAQMAQQQAAPPSSETQEQTAEAQNAQQDAEMQSAQAEQSAQQDQQKAASRRAAFRPFVGESEKVARLSDFIGRTHTLSKLAAPADRRLMQALMEGGGDTLGHQLLEGARRILPGEAAQAAAGQVAHQVVDAGADAVASAASKLPSLGEKLRPHLPGAVAGLGLGILGTKLLSRRQPEQPPPDISASPLSYAQYYGQQ